MSEVNVNLNLSSSKLINYVIAFFGFLGILFLLILPMLAMKDMTAYQAYGDAEKTFKIGKVLAGNTQILGICAFITFAGSILLVVRGIQGKIKVFHPMLLLVSTLFIGFAADSNEVLGTGSILNLVIFGLSTILAIVANILKKD